MRGPEAEKLQLLENIAELAQEIGLSCYGHGFPSLSLTICAVCMGYQNVSSPAVAGPTKRPEGMQAVEQETIYGRGLFKNDAQAG